MRVGIVSDTHDRAANVTTAVAMLRQQGVELLLHCGDITTVETVLLFAGLQAHFVFGNWGVDWVAGIDCSWAPPAFGHGEEDLVHQVVHVLLWDARPPASAGHEGRIALKNHLPGRIGACSGTLQEAAPWFGGKTIVGQYQTPQQEWLTPGGSLVLG
jgi:hypothetical protein